MIKYTSDMYSLLDSKLLLETEVGELYKRYTLYWIKNEQIIYSIKLIDKNDVLHVLDNLIDTLQAIRQDIDNE